MDMIAGQCCYLDARDPGVGCRLPARWGIANAESPADTVESCAEHVGALLRRDRLNYVWPLLPAAGREQCRECGTVVDGSLVVDWDRACGALCVRCAAGGEG